MKNHLVLKPYNLLATAIAPTFTASKLKNNKLEGTFYQLQGIHLITGVKYYYSIINTSLETYTNDNIDKSLLHEMSRIKQLVTKNQHSSAFYDLSKNNLANTQTTNDKSIYFVIGNSMSNRTLEMFESAKEYEDYVQDQAKKLEEYFTTLNTPILKVSIVPFNAIKCRNFEIYLRQHKKVKCMECMTEKDFLPSGYKTPFKEYCC
jgi:hypothetical protein